MRRFFLTLSLALLSSAAFPQYENLVIPGRPGQTPGTATIPRGVFQLDCGTTIGYDGFAHNMALLTTKLRYGVSDWAEVYLKYNGTLSIERIPFPSISESDNPELDVPEHTDPVSHMHSTSYSLSPLVFGTKLMLFEGRTWIPRTTLSLNMKVPCTSDMYDAGMHLAPEIYLTLFNQITPWMSFTYGTGAEWSGYSSTPDAFLGLFIDFSVTQRLSAFVETYNYFTRLTDFGPTYGSASSSTTAARCGLDFGFYYSVHPRVSLDLAAGFICQDPSSSAFIDFGVCYSINDPLPSRHHK